MFFNFMHLKKKGCVRTPKWGLESFDKFRKKLDNAID